MQPDPEPLGDARGQERERHAEQQRRAPDRRRRRRRGTRRAVPGRDRVAHALELVRVVRREPVQDLARRDVKKLPSKSIAHAPVPCGSCRRGSRVNSDGRAAPREPERRRMQTVDAARAHPRSSEARTPTRRSDRAMPASPSRGTTHRERHRGGRARRSFCAQERLGDNARSVRAATTSGEHQRAGRDGTIVRGVGRAPEQHRQRPDESEARAQRLPAARAAERRSAARRSARRRARRARRGRTSRRRRLDRAGRVTQSAASKAAADRVRGTARRWPIRRRAPARWPPPSSRACSRCQSATRAGAGSPPRRGSRSQPRPAAARLPATARLTAAASQRLVATNQMTQRQRDQLERDDRAERQRPPCRPGRASASRPPVRA